MLSTSVVQLCPTVALSPPPDVNIVQQAHLITASDIVLHAYSPCCQRLTESVADTIWKPVSDFCCQFHITKPETSKPVTI